MISILSYRIRGDFHYSQRKFRAFSIHSPNERYTGFQREIFITRKIRRFWPGVHGITALLKVRFGRSGLGCCVGFVQELTLVNGGDSRAKPGCPGIVENPGPFNQKSSLLQPLVWHGSVEFENHQATDTNDIPDGQLRNIGAGFKRMNRHRAGDNYFLKAFDL